MADPGAAPASGSGPTLLFIGGERKQVGKSTACLGILATLLADGYPPSALAYIKPATQCTKSQLVARFCAAVGIEAVPIGPIVFRSGFTREHLRERAVRDLGAGKRLVIVDGVGYAAVGSICGVSNADIAARLGAPVLLIGKSGVGDAVDSHNLNAAFFESRGARVLGAVFNRLPQEGFYSVDKCREYVDLYFQTRRPGQRAYGFLPEVGGMGEEEDAPEEAQGGGEEAGPGPDGWAPVLASTARLEGLGLSPHDARRVSAAYTAFSERVDVAGIVADAAAAPAPAAAPEGRDTDAPGVGRVALSWSARVGEDTCGDGGY